jgi:hypothetical protein
MYTLTSDTLTVTILDPVADQERFGPRYCTGGYIFQVEDARLGPLMSGPTYPHDFNWFDGQGIPDAFNLGPLRSPDTGDQTALVIGIGECDLAAPKVLRFCEWDVEQRPGELTMRTTQAFGRYQLTLERTVSLSGRTVRSATRLDNTGAMFIPMRWFPHPFYPHPASDELCRVNFPVGIPAGAKYELAPSGFIKHNGWPWAEGYFQALDHDAQTDLVILQKHPLLGLVAATCSYAPTFFPIWGNTNTFSWEPYLERTVATGQSLNWSIDYEF